MQTNLVWKFICGLFICLIAANSSMAEEDVENALVAKITFSKCVVFIYPSYNLSKNGYSSSDGSFGDPDNDDEDALWYSAWISENETIISIGNHLFVRNKHYFIPDFCKEIWIINGKVLDPNGGKIQESKVPKALEKEMNSSRNDETGIAEGVEFTVKNAFLGGSSFRKDNDLNWRFTFGGCFFNLKEGNLFFRQKNYGPLKKGNKVVVDKDGNISVIRDSSK